MSENEISEYTGQIKTPIIVTIFTGITLKAWIKPFSSKNAKIIDVGLTFNFLYMKKCCNSMYTHTHTQICLSFNSMLCPPGMKKSVMLNGSAAHSATLCSLPPITITSELSSGAVCATG